MTNKLISDYAFVQIKAYGDLTIAAATLRNVPCESLARCKLLISPHLSDLAKVLKPNCEVEMLPIREPHVPAVFDLKKCGLISGLRSALTLRRVLAEAAAGSILVMPRRSLREAFIASRRRSVSLPMAGNVYAAYAMFWKYHIASSTKGVQSPTTSRLHRIAICPMSRMAAKNIPPDLVVQLAEVCVRAGYVAELLMLEGETLNHSVALPTRVIPRRFDALAEALANYAGAICADSLPAHLAEYQGTPAFVVSPTPNPYWLPEQAYKCGYWGIFNQRSELTACVARFLNVALVAASSRESRLP